MSEKKKADIIIRGNVFTITGRDAAAKGDKIAALVNETIYKVKTLQSSRTLSWDHVLTLALINLADDLIAEVDKDAESKSQYAALQKRCKKLEAKIDSLQCDLMSLEQENMDLQERLDEQQ